MGKHVETQVQLHAETVLGLNEKLWRVPGVGGPKGIGPYKVGVRFVPHMADGNLPHGFFHTF